MFCEKCGSELLQEAKFCEQCGFEAAPIAQAAVQSTLSGTNSPASETTSAAPNLPAKQAPFLSFSPAAGWGIALAGLISIAAAVVRIESPDLIPLAIWYSFWRGLFPFGVGIYLLIWRARVPAVALVLILVLLVLALKDLISIYSLINIWNPEGLMELYGIRLVSDFLILHSVLLRFFSFNWKSQKT